MANISDYLQTENNELSLLNALKDNIMVNLHVADVCKVIQGIDTLESQESEEEEEQQETSTNDWSERTTNVGLEYGGTAQAYYWDAGSNPNSTFNNCMPNCTTYAYGRELEAGGKAPVSQVVNGGNWHEHVTNGWTALPYNESLVNVGDIIEWPGHVAVVEKVEGGIMVSGSHYTGEHGEAHYGEGFDTRTPGIQWMARGGAISPYTINSMKDISKWMLSASSYRFFHYNSLDAESSAVGESPTYILKNPGLFGNKRKFRCISITNGMTIECYCLSNIQVNPNDIAVILFVDREYQTNLVKIRKDQQLINSDEIDNIHSNSFGIIIGTI